MDLAFHQIPLIREEGRSEVAVLQLDIYPPGTDPCIKGEPKLRIFLPVESKTIISEKQPGPQSISPKEEVDFPEHML